MQDKNVASQLDARHLFAGCLLAPAHLPQEAAQIGGHIPTAGNVPWSKAANDDGTFRSDDELKALRGVPVALGDEAGVA